MKYHINANGNPGLCKATKSCPFGSAEDHFDTKDEARKAFEQSMDKNSFKSYKKISFEQHKDQLIQGFKETFPDVKVVQRPRANAQELGLRSTQEVVFKAQAVGMYDFNYGPTAIKKWAQDNNLKVVTNEGNMPRGVLYHYMIISKPEPTAKEKIARKQDEIKRLQEEIKQLEKVED